MKTSIMQQHKLQKIVFNTKRAFFKNKLTESIGKPKDLWNTLKSLGLPNKVSSCEGKTLKINNAVEHDVNFGREPWKITPPTTK